MNPPEDRPRPSLAETLRSLTVVRVVVMGVLMLLGLALASAPRLSPLHPVVGSVVTLGLCAALICLYRGLVFFFERDWTRETDFDLRWAGLGLFTGFLFFCVVYLILTVLGVASWHGVNGFANVHQLLLTTLVAAVGEELVFRGVMFRVLEQGFGSAAALLVSSALFGALHAGNPGATVLSTVAVALEAGLLLGAAYAWSRNLWFVFGLHFAWNFTEGGIFGAAVSGHAARGLLEVPLSDTASPLLSGGAFGPEASVISVLVCLGLAAAFINRAAGTGRWQAPAVRLRLSEAKRREAGPCLSPTRLAGVPEIV